MSLLNLKTLLFSEIEIQKMVFYTKLINLTAWRTQYYDKSHYFCGK